MGSTSGQNLNSVEVFKLSRRYGRRWALVDVSFEVPRGKAMMVAGRNGSGKSTLLRVLSTALRPDGGTARFDGLDIRTHRQQVRRRVAVLGHASYTYDAMTALENLQLVARLIGKDASRDALMPLLEEVGLAERWDDNILSFSAGMRKRISIARVLLQGADVVMLDEPYGQLDPPGFRFVDALIGKLRDRGTTILIATHQLDRGAALCDLGIVLERGRLQWTGDARDLPTLGGLDPASTPEGAS
jgi:heme exporter protein A